MQHWSVATVRKTAAPTGAWLTYSWIHFCPCLLNRLIDSLCTFVHFLSSPFRYDYDGSQEDALLPLEKVLDTSKDSSFVPGQCVDGEASRDAAYGQDR